MKFSDLSLLPLLRAVEEAGYVEPSPIQQKAIPPVLEGRDLLGCAQTGTGKTAAFALPILQLLTADAPQSGKKKIRTLVLTPTRELALQIQESFEQYGKYLPLRSVVIFGGVGQNPQVAALRKGVDILVATPGRLLDLMGQGHIDLSRIEIFVLDEADRMLDMGFIHDVRRVLEKLPPKKQTLLFSATMPPEIVQLADKLLHKPAKVFVTPVSSTVEAIEQQLYKVDKANKRHLLADLLRNNEVANALVFTRTKHGADRVARDLTRAGIKAMAIHGNKGQNARQDALARFKDGRIRVLVATDIAARGLDINELSHVVNYDLPNIPETYVHRIGRTGRAGHAGTAISFCCFDELDCLKDIEKLIGFRVPEQQGHAWPMQVLQKTEKQPQPGGRKETKKQGEIKQAEKPQKNGKEIQKKTQAKIPAKTPKAPSIKEPAQPASPRAVRMDHLAEKAKKQARVNQNGKPRTAADKGAGPASNRGKTRREPPNPYENLTGGKAIVTKRPIWADAPPQEPAPAQEGENDMARNNRRRGGKNRGKQNKNGQPAEQKAEKKPEIPKNENGVFNFSEEELAEDNSIQVISRTNSETKYANFEDFLKDKGI